METATKQTYTIKHRITGAVLWSGDTESLRNALEIAVGAKANLSGAYLSGAYLSGADLRRAYLSGAYLSGADLRRANLRSANLSGANLSGAYLSGAYLSGADLRRAYLSGAYLSGADLRRAYLSGAYLSGANLSGANLRSANLMPIRDDFWAVLSAQPKEVPALRLALIEGRVDGSTYEGKCACLVGTLANAANCPYGDLPILKANSDRPAERFFMLIHPDDTPELCQASKIALEWTDTWLDNMRSASAAGTFNPVAA